MKYTVLLLAVCTTFFSCGKKETAQPITKPTEVEVQTEYRLIEEYTDTSLIKSYSYNSDNLIKSITSYRNSLFGYFTTPTLISATVYYEYDKNFRILRTGTGSPQSARIYSSFIYNNDMMPIARHHTNIEHPEAEMRYNGNKLIELKNYALNGRLYNTHRWTYYANGNPETHIIEDSFSKRVLSQVFLKYDDAHALRLARPGIQDLPYPFYGHTTESAVPSVNNVLKVEQDEYFVDGTHKRKTIDCTYEYNSGNFPIKAVATVTVFLGDSYVEQPIYYKYNK